MNLLAYIAIAAQAESIGWPLVHTTDLTAKDAHTCASMAPGDAFLWVLRETGTSLIVIHAETDVAAVEKRLLNLQKHGACRFFFWSAGELAETVDLDEALFVLEDRARELRYRERRSA